MPDDEQKSKAGRALIKLFCTPQTPSRTNGNRKRTLPQHEPERWELFKSYCAQDVEAERAVARKLQAFRVPKKISAEWRTDIKINARGVKIDRELVETSRGDRQHDQRGAQKKRCRT